MSRILDDALSILNEAYSDSLPKWFRTRLQFQSPNSITDRLRTASRELSAAEAEKSLYPDKYEKAKDRFDRLNKKYGDALKQNNPLYGSRYEGSRNLVNSLIRAGYDPSGIVVVEQDVPQSLNDEIFSNPDALPVFHIVTDNDDKVWIQGINDEEKYLDDAGKEQTFKYFNNAKLKQYVKDFAYIDLSAPETHMSDLTTGRSEDANKYYSGKPVNYATTGVRNQISARELYDKDLQNRRFVKGKDSSISDELFDKSGYFRGTRGTELSTRLRKELEKLGSKKIPKKVLELEKNIIQVSEDIKKWLRNSYQMNDISSFDSQNIYAARDVLSNLSSLLDYWRSLKRYLDNELRENPDRDDFSSTVKDYLRYTTGKLDEVKNRIGKGFNPASFIW